MLTSKERAELRAQANALDTTLIVGKGGISETLIADVENQLNARELVKGKVLEGALLTAREASDAICEETGADGVSVVGNKFVIYRFSEKLQAERNMSGRAKRKPTPVSKQNPVRKGAKARRDAAKKQREQRNEYFRQQAIEKAIEKAREKQLHGEE
jgi:RNA-binding protein